MTITQEEWDEQLTRPWLFDVTPDAVFPGTTVVFKGSRFTDTDRLVIAGEEVDGTLRADGGMDVVVPEHLNGGRHEVFTPARGRRGVQPSPAGDQTPAHRPAPSPCTGRYGHTHCTGAA